MAITANIILELAAMVEIYNGVSAKNHSYEAMEAPAFIIAKTVSAQNMFLRWASVARRLFFISTKDINKNKAIYMPWRIFINLSQWMLRD